MPSQWAEKHECLFRSRSTGLLFRGAGFSLPLLADAWGASGLSQDLCSLPPCGTLELNMWLSSHSQHHLLAMDLHMHTELQPDTPPQQPCTSWPASLQPLSALLFPLALLLPLQDHATAMGTVTVGWARRCHARCPPKPVVSQWQCWQPGIKSQQGCPLFHLTQCSPAHLCWPFHSVLNMREDMCLYYSS